MLSRQTFGAYDPDVWTIQWILTNLEYDPGAIDGLWGSKTFGAVSDFRQMNNLGPASNTTLAGAADDAFRTALWGQAIEAGLDVPTAPSSGTSGGTSSTPVVVKSSSSMPTVSTSSGGAAPAPQSGGIDTSALLALGAVGIGAVLLSRGSSRRRR